MIAGYYPANSGTSTGTATVDTSVCDCYETIEAMFDRPGVTHHVRTSWQGTKEVVEFIKIDNDGFITTTSQIWNRTAKEPPDPVQGPPKRLRFLTANRCDHNRGRHWDRKIA